MTLTTINLAALGDTINLSTEVTGTLPTGNGGTGSTATTFVNATTNVTGALPIANGGTGATSFNPGKVLQVITAQDNTELSLSSATYTDVGLSASITPSASSSKVLAFWTVHSRFQASPVGYGTRILRGATSVFETQRDYYIYGNYVNDRRSIMLNYLDSPSTTSSTTYKIQVATNSGQVDFNGNSNQSIMTLMEIAG